MPSHQPYPTLGKLRLSTASSSLTEPLVNGDFALIWVCQNPLDSSF
jgi:hypothetical protein